MPTGSLRRFDADVVYWPRPEAARRLRLAIYLLPLSFVCLLSAGLSSTALLVVAPLEMLTLALWAALYAQWAEPRRRSIEIDDRNVVIRGGRRVRRYSLPKPRDGELYLLPGAEGAYVGLGTTGLFRIYVGLASRAE